MKTLSIRVAAIAVALLFTLQLSAQTYTSCATPDGLAFDGSHIWVACHGLQEVEELNASNGALVRTVSGVTYPFALAYDGANIWATENSSNKVAKIQASTGTVLGTFSVGAGPLGITFDGTYIWTANANGNSVSKILATTGAVTTYSVAGCWAGGIAFDGTHIWVSCGEGTPNQNTVRELSKSGAKLATVTLPAQTYGLTYDGTNIWVGLGQGSSKINVATRAVTNYPGGSFFAGMAYDGTHIWECGTETSGQPAVVEVIASTGATVATYPVGGEGVIQSCVFAAGYLWESNYNASSVTKIP